MPESAQRGPGRWDDVRTFLALAHAGAFGRAGRALGVDASTVHRRIAQLETELGVRRFERSARGVQLTPAGETMLAHATRVDDAMTSLVRGVAGADERPTGRLRITTVDEVLAPLATHLRRFQALHPGIDLELRSELRVYSLARHEVDVALRPGGPPTEPDVVGRALVPLTLGAYAAASYLDGRPRPRTLDALAGHALVRFPGERGPLLPDHPALGAMRTACTATSMSALSLAAGGGLGVAFLPTFVGDANAELVRLMTFPRSASYHLWLLVHADVRRSARVRAFLEFLTEAVRADPAWAPPDE